MEFQIGENITFTLPSTQLKEQGKIVQLLDSGSYLVKYGLPSGFFAEIEVRPELIEKFNPLANAPADLRHREVESPLIIEQSLKSLVQKKAAFYGGFILEPQLGATPEDCEAVFQKHKQDLLA